MEVGSWSYDDNVIDIQFAEEAVDLHDYRNNSEWELMKVSYYRNTKNYTLGSFSTLLWGVSRIRDH